MKIWFTNAYVAPQLSGGSNLWGSSEASPT
jgi:hypothetical protein